MDDKWRTTSCYCSNGLKWGYDEPIECDNCDGGGTVWIRPGGHTFAWPGGPATGMDSKEAYEKGTPQMPYERHSWINPQEEVDNFILDRNAGFDVDLNTVDCACGFRGSIKEHDKHAEQMKQQFIAERQGVAQFG